VAPTGIKRIPQKKGGKDKDYYNPRGIRGRALLKTPNGAKGKKKPQPLGKGAQKNRPILGNLGLLYPTPQKFVVPKRRINPPTKKFKTGPPKKLGIRSATKELSPLFPKKKEVY